MLFETELEDLRNQTPHTQKVIIIIIINTPGQEKIRLDRQSLPLNSITMPPSSAPPEHNRSGQALKSAV